VFDQLHRARLPRFEAHRRTRRYVEAKSSGEVAVEAQTRIRLEKMVVRAHLNGPVAAIIDLDRDGPAIRIQFDITGRREYFTGYHRCLLVKRPDDGRSRVWCRPQMWPRPGFRESSRAHPPTPPPAR